MLHKAAFGGLHLHAAVLDGAEQEGGNQPVHADFGEDDRVVGGDGEVFAIGHQLEPAVPRHVVVHVGEDVAGDLILGECEELPLHLLGLPAERGGIPEGERGNPIGVDVLGRLHQFGKAAECVTGLFELRGVGLEQDGLVGLNDDGVFGSKGHDSPTSRGDHGRPWEGLEGAAR